MYSSSSDNGQPDMPASKDSKAPIEDPAKLPYFPLGYKAAAWQWWTNITPATAEHNVLSLIPFIQSASSPSKKEPLRSSSRSIEAEIAKDPHGSRAWYSKMIVLNGNDRFLNEFSVERVGEQVEQSLVMLHGYGAGLGFFYKNFEGLSRVKGWKIYALDMLGMGRSSRPPFKIHAKDLAGKICEAESWFVDSLEEWRILKKIDRFTLLGHSMGGYMAVAYALKYPGHLNKLILASPVGIPEDPHAKHNNILESKQLSLAQEFTQSQDETTKNSNSFKDQGNDKTDQNSQNLDELAKVKMEAPPRRNLPRWLVYLWDANVSPFSIIRWVGPLGPRIVSGWSSRRFSHLPSNESKALHEYAYTLFRQRGSGEYALAYILAPGAFARDPLIRRIHKVGRQEIKAKTDNDDNGTSLVTETVEKETGIPLVFMYGENDWMDVAGGFAAEQKLNEEKTKVLQTASEEERSKEKGSVKVLIIKNAGHHLYLDGWEEFNEVLRKEMYETTTQERAENSLL